MKASKIKQLSRQGIEQLIDSLKKGKSKQLISYLKAMAKFHNYSLANTVLINLQRPSASRVAGFNTWRKLGRSVKKGEKGIAIMAPVIYRKQRVNDDEQDLDEKPEQEEIRTFKAVHVFDISQTKGKNLPEFATARGSPGVYIDRLKEYIESCGIKIESKNYLKDLEGASCGGRIFIKKNMSPAQQVSVLCHELAHELLHRDNVEEVSKKVIEAEAEATAFVVCSGIGLDPGSSSSDYIQLYNGDKDTVISSLARIKVTASRILNAVLLDRLNQTAKRAA
jgi:antirestriction protein ArdC